MKPDVLIVEDEPAIMTSLEFILRHAGWVTACVADGEAAISYVRSSMPRAVVLDLMLPRKNGFEVLKTLRSEPATSKLPILILTAKGQQQDRHTAMDLGASSFVTKPYSNSDVVMAVQKLIGPPDSPARSTAAEKNNVQT